MSEGWAKIKQCAEYAGVSERTLRDWLKEGLEHSRLPSGMLLIRFSNIDSFLKQFSVTGDRDRQINRIANETLKRFPHKIHEEAPKKVVAAVAGAKA